MVPEYQCPSHTLLLVRNDIPDSVIKRVKGLRAADCRCFLLRKKEGKKTPELFYASLMHHGGIQVSVQEWLCKYHSLCTSIMSKLRVIF